jgi:hypothetical protein
MDAVWLVQDTDIRSSRAGVSGLNAAPHPWGTGLDESSRWHVPDADADPTVTVADWDADPPGPWQVRV